MASKTFFDKYVKAEISADAQWPSCSFDVVDHFPLCLSSQLLEDLCLEEKAYSQTHAMMSCVSTSVRDDKEEGPPGEVRVGNAVWDELPAHLIAGLEKSLSNPPRDFIAFAGANGNLLNTFLNPFHKWCEHRASNRLATIGEMFDDNADELPKGACLVEITNSVNAVSVESQPPLPAVVGIISELEHLASMAAADPTRVQFDPHLTVP